MEQLPPKYHPTPHPGTRARLFTVFAFFSAITLTACGADVNTQLKLQEDHSGQRQFVMTMADEDAQNLAGGVDGAAQALEAHTPDELTFEGIEQEEAGYSATFTMYFDDVTDYENKIGALLDVSDVPQDDREMNVRVDRQQLVTSVVLKSHSTTMTSWDGPPTLWSKRRLYRQRLRCSRPQGRPPLYMTAKKSKPPLLSPESISV